MTSLDLPRAKSKMNLDSLKFGSSFEFCGDHYIFPKPLPGEGSPCGNLSVVLLHKTSGQACLVLLHRSTLVSATDCHIKVTT